MAHTGTDGSSYPGDKIFLRKLGQHRISMIYDVPLTDAQRAASQKNYNIFNIINGLSYMCLGETVMILLAVRLECRDYVVSTLGAMIYLGFLMLPWGRVVTARVGAAKAQANFWVARNCAALLVASATVFNHCNLHGAAVAVLLGGSFLFYGFRAAGVVMSQPLIGDITTDSDRGALLARSGGLFYAFCFVALIVISIILSINDGLWVLTGVIAAGAGLGCTASRFLARIDETEKSRTAARRPIGGELRTVINNRELRQQLFSGFAINLGIIILIPVSMLALKRGMNISDTEAMLFALCQFGASAGMSFLTGRISARIGPRKTMLYAFLALLLISAVWQIVPSAFNAWAMIPIFILAGAAMVSMNNGNVHYFLQTIPEEQRVTASMFVSVFTGAGAGIAGMALAGVLLKLCGNPQNFLEGYRLYFIVAAAALAPGIWLIARLRPLPDEKRSVAQNVLNDQFGNRVNYLHNSERLFKKSAGIINEKEEKETNHENSNH